MKKINYLLSSIFLISTMFSCSSDDGGESTVSKPGDEDVAIAQNLTENEPIEIAVLNSGLAIENGTKLSGVPPTPNEAVDLKISTENQEAFQGVGFNINFSSDSDISGAYIQFKDVEGNAIAGYYDVPVGDAFAKKLNKTSKRKSSSLMAVNKSAKNLEDFDEFLIEVEFEEQVPAGEFCYDICLYDSENNISRIETICVTVEAWGGNADLVGEWEASEGDLFDDEDTVILYCFNTDEEFEAPSTTSNSSSDYVLVLNQDGTYYEVYDDKGVIDYAQSEERCEAIYGNEKEKYSGNWAYNEEKGTLTIIDFKFEDLLNPENSEVYEDGELYFDGAEITNVTSNSFKLSTTDFDETFEVTFTRK